MPYKMKFELEAEARGLEKGGRAALLAVLEARFAPLPPDITSRLEGVSGAEQLERLVRLAAVAPTLDDVLRDIDAPRAERES